LFFSILISLSDTVKREIIQTAVTISYTVSQKNDTDVAHYNFNAHHLIFVIVATNVAKRVCHRMVICYTTCRN